MKYFISVRRITILIWLMFFSYQQVQAQGRNSTFLLGYNSKARMTFTSSSFSILPESRVIPFDYTQGNISDENGNLLMSSNGVFIADATGDTMQNGEGLNPGQFTNDYSGGLPIPYANLFLPFPNDSNKYLLLHQTGNYNNPLFMPTVLYSSIIDISLNSGLGSVISKNDTLLIGLFGGGLSACKHGNGRDWWIIALSDNGTITYKFLLTPDTITYIGNQYMNVLSHVGFSAQPSFSPNGEKFGYVSGDGFNGPWLMSANLFSFDRCSGQFSLDTSINYMDGSPGFGSSFSSNSKYFYFSTTKHIYQICTDTSNIAATFQLVATNDTFLSAPPVFYTDFHLMYLAKNGKIYISSGSSVKHLHEINYPDSAGVACNVNLHNIHTNCFFIGVPNHPNYYLGRLVGSACDTLTSVNEIEQHDFRFSISPNPNNGNFRIMYLLPQNKNGTLQIFDITGKEVYSQNLPPWSTLQFISVPKLSDGVYHCSITSQNFRVSKKLIIIH